MVSNQTVKNKDFKYHIFSIKICYRIFFYMFSIENSDGIKIIWSLKSFLSTFYQNLNFKNRVKILLLQALKLSTHFLSFDVQFYYMLHHFTNTSLRHHIKKSHAFSVFALHACLLAVRVCVGPLQHNIAK